MPIDEIHLNRRGINSIEVPAEIETTIGSEVTLRLINHGSPLHITLSSPNSAMFTDFFHENFYIDGEAEFRVPIREAAYPGFFDVNVISGYGTRRAQFRVVVREPAKPECPSAEAPPLPPRREVRWERMPVPTLILGGVSLVLYALWVMFGLDILNAAAFAALVLGVILLWFRQRS
jgi:hypothetical protein